MRFLSWWEVMASDGQDERLARERSGVGDGRVRDQARHNDERMRPWSTARRRVSGSAHTFVFVTPSD
jgi:hypothetical protein